MNTASSPDIFTHKFSGFMPAEARRHVNPDGSLGGIVALTASIAGDIRLGLTVEVGPREFVGYGASIGYGDWFIYCGPQGSRNAMLTALQTKDGSRWWVGCKTNITTNDLRAMVADTHDNNDHGAEYLHVIAFVEAHPARLRCEAARKLEVAE